MPLHKIDKFNNQFIDRGWVKPTKRDRQSYHLYDCTHFLMMTVLEYLGNRRPFHLFKFETALSVDKHSHFSSLYKKDNFVQG